MVVEKVGLQKIVYEKIKNEVLTPKENNDYSVLIMDKESASLVSQFCKASDIISHKVASIEDIAKKRKPFPELNAIYLIKPDRNCVKLIIEDFNLNSKQQPRAQLEIKEPERPEEKKSILQKIICFRKLYEHYNNYVYKYDQKEPDEANKKEEEDLTARYKSAYIYFIGRSDANLEKILNESPAGKYIRERIKYIDVNYFPVERQVFSMRLPEISYEFYKERSESKMPYLDMLADQVVSMCLSLDEYPSIRYINNVHNLRDNFAILVQDKLDKLKQSNPKLGIESGKAKSMLLILDRSFDPVSPLLHEFTYQAMAYDLVKISDDNKYEYETATGKKANHELNEEDVVWTELRHQHVDVTKRLLVENFRKFKASKPQIESNNLDLKELRQIVQKLPQLKKEIESYEVHLSLTDECFRNYNEKRKKMSRYEQSLAMNCEPNDEPLRDLDKDIVALILDPDFGEYDKLRLLMLIFLNKNGVNESSLEIYLNKLNDKQKGTKVLQSLRKLGLEIIKDVDRPNVNIDREEKRKRDFQYDESRWTPLVKDLIEDIIENKLNKTKYPYLKDSLSNQVNTPPAGGISARVGGVVRRQEKGPTLIVFVIGGVTYSEMRSAYEVQRDAINKENWQIYIGANQIIRPDDFIENLSKI